MFAYYICIVFCCVLVKCVVCCICVVLCCVCCAYVADVCVCVVDLEVIGVENAVDRRDGRGRERRGEE